MSDLSQFLSDVPLGTVVQSVINLATVTGGKYIALDGRDCVRTSYAEISPYFPIGVFTGTSRTLGANPVSKVVASDNTNFLLPGAMGTSPLQASADGVSWSTSATWATSTAPACIIRAGSRFVMAGNGGDLTAPYVAAIDQTAANIVAKANWTVTTGGTTMANTSRGLAYSPSLGLTVMITGSTGAYVYTLADASTAWTARAITSSTPRAICWTGQRFLMSDAIVSGHLIYSTDGVTFNDLYVPKYVGAANCLASDGNGTVVSMYGEYVMVSKDHGVTWGEVLLPFERSVPGSSASIAWGGQNAAVDYLNGKFIIGSAGASDGFAFSSNGVTWFYEPSDYRLANNGGKHLFPGYKAGVYLFVSDAQSAITATEDTTKFRIPTSQRFTSGSSFLGSVTNWQEYMKVKP